MSPPHTVPPSLVSSLLEFGSGVEVARGKLKFESCGARLYTAVVVTTLKVDPGKKVSAVARGTPGKNPSAVVLQVVRVPGHVLRLLIGRRQEVRVEGGRRVVGDHCTGLRNDSEYRGVLVGAHDLAERVLRATSWSLGSMVKVRLSIVLWRGLSPSTWENDCAGSVWVTSESLYWYSRPAVP